MKLDLQLLKEAFENSMGSTKITRCPDCKKITNTNLEVKPGTLCQCKQSNEGILDPDNKRLIRATIQRGEEDPNFKNDILYKKALFYGTPHSEVRFEDWLKKYDAGMYNTQEEPAMAEASPKANRPRFNTGVKSILTPEDIEAVNRILNNQEELGDNEELWQKLYDYYLAEMPYGTQKARTGDPMEFVQDKLEQEFLGRTF